LDPDVYASVYGHCEVLIVGAGPAGVSAALAAAKKGGRVILVDEQAQFGGSLLSSPGVEIDGISAQDWLTKALQTLSKSGNVTLMTRTTAIGYYHDNFVALNEPQSFLGQYGVAVGKDVVVFTSHDSAYQSAFELADANIHIAAIVDVRDCRCPRRDLGGGETSRYGERHRADGRGSSIKNLR